MSSFSKRTSTSSSDENVELRRGPWILEEDTLLIHYIASHGEGHWNLLAKHSGLKRTGKSCRLRWLNYLKPDVKHGNLTPQEQLLILQLHSKWGNRWSKIAKYLPGRTDNEIKNYWRTRVQKQARQLKIDCNSRVFEEVIRCIWMPRLLQKIHSSSSPSLPMSSGNSGTVVQSPHVPAQGPFHISTTACSLDLYTNDPISNHCNNNSPSVSSQVLPTSTSCHGMDNIDCNTLVEGCYNVGNNFSNDMETIGVASMTAFGDYVNPIGRSNIMTDVDFDDSLWNMDGLWQGMNT